MAKNKPHKSGGHERFTAEWWAAWTLYDPATGCLNWSGFRCPEGRGRTSYRGKGGMLVYRIAFEQAYGPINPTLKVCHTCDNPSCVNVDHLFLGTQRDNLRDMFAKGRARPRGKPSRNANVATLSPSPLAAIDGGSRCVSRWHSTSYTNEFPPYTGAIESPAWCRVTGVPTSQPTRAIVLYNPPQKWTPEPWSPARPGYGLSAQCPVGGVGSLVPSTSERQPGGGT